MSAGGGAGTALCALLASGALDLPLPGRGETPERHRRLLELARSQPVSVARLAEAHTDAVAIRAEAGRRTAPDLLYGVWASASATDGLVVDADGRTVSGTKHMCSGAGVVDRALVTATGADGRHLLVDVAVDPCRAPSVVVDVDAWGTPALAESRTGRVTFDDHPLDGDAVIGSPDFYLGRAGFWHGACGPAACWAGAAIGLVDRAEDLTDDDPHRRADLGAMRALTWGMRALLDRAGVEIDDGSDDVVQAHTRALAPRHLVERSCTEVLDRFGQALGPRPFASDPDVAQRQADVHLYLRQQHGARDLHALGTAPRPR